MFWIRGRGRATAAEPGGFTGLVRSIAEGRRLDEKSFGAAWSELGAVLRAELKRRGLWESPPSYLGVFGWGNWEEAAFDELLTECYTYVFVDRIRSLQAQLKLKPNIEGLVSLSVRHFVHERQKENDPIGSQVFEVLQSAVRRAVEGRELEVIAGDEKIRNDTVLAFRPSAVSAVPVQDREKLVALAAAWNDELLPDLITLRGQKQEEVVQRLRGRLGDLRTEGIEAFRFKDVVDPLKADVRARWAALLDRSQGDPAPGESPGEVVRLVPPDIQVEERQVFRKLVNCVLTGIRRLDTSEKTRGYLLTLWQFLRVQASGGAEVTSRFSLLAEEDDEPPSQRKLAEQLRIPRERLPGLYDILRDLMVKCQAAISGAISEKTAVIPLQRNSISRDRRPRPDDH